MQLNRVPECRTHSYKLLVAVGLAASIIVRGQFIQICCAKQLQPSQKGLTGTVLHTGECFLAKAVEAKK